MIDWNVWKDKIHALQVERGVWKCAGDTHAPKVFNAMWSQRHLDDKAIVMQDKYGRDGYSLYCPTCNGTGKHRDVAEIICDVNEDLTVAWQWYKSKRDIGSYHPSVAERALATAALRVLDLTGYLQPNLPAFRKSASSPDSVTIIFARAHQSVGLLTGRVWSAMWHVLWDIGDLATKLGIDLEAAMTARFEEIRNGGEL